MADAASQLDAAPLADVELVFETLSGRQCSLRCPASTPLKSLHPDILQAFELSPNEVPGTPTPPIKLCLAEEESSLRANTLASEVAGKRMRVVLLPWCSGKLLRNSWAGGRIWETSEESTIRLRSDGSFTYTWDMVEKESVEEGEELPPGLWYRSLGVLAQGQWTFSEETGEGSVITLSGEATRETDGRYDMQSRDDASDYAPSAVYAPSCFASEDLDGDVDGALLGPEDGPLEPRDTEDEHGGVLHNDFAEIGEHRAPGTPPTDEYEYGCITPPWVAEEKYGCFTFSLFNRWHDAQHKLPSGVKTRPFLLKLSSEELLNKVQGNSRAFGRRFFEEDLRELVDESADWEMEDLEE